MSQLPLWRFAHYINYTIIFIMCARSIIYNIIVDTSTIEVHSYACRASSYPLPLLQPGCDGDATRARG